MCRRVVTHHMHHDVVATMTIDAVAIGDPIVYANPLRTNIHSCEIVPPMYDSLLNSPTVTCPYHTCCIPYTSIHACDANDMSAHIGWRGHVQRNHEPEDCDAFIVEHHHKCVPYFGNDAVTDAAYAQGEQPPPWRVVNTLRGEQEDWEWFPDFSHSVAQRAGWEERYFAECETLYVLQYDTATLHQSLRSMLDEDPNASEFDIQNAKTLIFQSEEKLYEQRRLVFDLYNWAWEPCGSC